MSFNHNTHLINSTNVLLTRKYDDDDDVDDDYDDDAWFHYIYYGYRLNVCVCVMCVRVS